MDMIQHAVSCSIVTREREREGERESERARERERERVRGFPELSHLSFLTVSSREINLRIILHG